MTRAVGCADLVMRLANRSRLHINCLIGSSCCGLSVRTHYLALVAVLTIAFGASPATAGETLDVCLDPAREPTERLVACTDAIESGNLNKRDRIAAYRERAVLYLEIGEYNATIRGLIAEANAHLDQDELEDAWRAFRRALLIDPGLDEALEGCADVLTQMGYDDAVEIASRDACAVSELDVAETSVDESPDIQRPKTREFGDDVRNLLLSMWDSHIAGDAFRAAIHYTRAVEENPDAVYCLWELKRGFDGHVLRQYDKVLRPELYEQGPIPRTLPEIQAVLSQDPNDLDALRDRAMLFAASGGAAAAVRDLDRALEINPESIELMVLNTKAHFDFLESRIFWSALFEAHRRYYTPDVLDPRAYDLGFPANHRRHYQPDEWLATIERAIGLGADDFFTWWTYWQALPPVTEERRAARDRAIELLPTWPESLVKRFFGFKLYSERAADVIDYSNIDAYSDAMDLALNPPGVESDLYDPRCYSP